MVDQPQTIGIATGAPVVFEEKKKQLTIKDVCKVYISIIGRWSRLVRKSSPSRTSKPSFPNKEAELQEATVEIIDEDSEELGDDKEEETAMHGLQSMRFNTDSFRGNAKGFYKHKSADNTFPNRYTPSFLHRRSNRMSTDFVNGFPTSLSRNSSRNTTPIMFSNSAGRIKPAAIQKNLECSLEELCNGCKKKIKVTRDVLTSTGKIIQEEETLTIKVKPGWKSGTKITFEGMGYERPGSSVADITFVIAEKRHPLFRREGDDLEITVEVPLVEALTGCEISIPLLGEEPMRLNTDEIIYPGYEKNIPGHGMPNTKDGKRGDLKVVFLVEFPKELTDEQRSHIVRILGILHELC